MGRRLDAITFGPQRRSRRMMRRLEQLDREDARLRAAGLDPLDLWHRSRDPRLGPTRAPVVRRPRRVRFVLAAVTAATAVIALLIYQRGPEPLRPQAAASAIRPDTLPPRGVDEQAERVGAPLPAPAGEGGYRFERTQPDGVTPVAWDPCRPIHYVVSGTAPAGEAGVITSALTEVSRLTGFRFVNDGATTEPANPDRAPYQPGLYGRRWAPVLIAWTTPTQVPALAGNVIGLGGGTALRFDTSASTYVSGIVYLDKRQYTTSLTRARKSGHIRVVLRAVVLHEVGHLLGLAHVTDPNSVMYPETSLTATDYSSGDRRGLYAEAEGRCAPDL